MRKIDAHIRSSVLNAVTREWVLVVLVAPQQEVVSHA